MLCKNNGNQFDNLQAQSTELSKHTLEKLVPDQKSMMVEQSLIPFSRLTFITYNTQDEQLHFYVMHKYVEPNTNLIHQ
jgi:hypothetical protein